MYRRFFMVIAALVLASTPIMANAQLPFGGMIVFTRPCNTGQLLTVLGFNGPKDFMWFTGELPFMMFVPPHIGQNLIGESLLATVPCVVGNTTVGNGLPIMFHGESD